MSIAYYLIPAIIIFVSCFAAVGLGKTRYRSFMAPVWIVIIPFLLTFISTAVNAALVPTAADPMESMVFIMFALPLALVSLALWYVTAHRQRKEKQQSQE